jgi:hypothetical protein
MAKVRAIVKIEIPIVRGVIDRNIEVDVIIKIVVIVIIISIL